MLILFLLAFPAQCEEMSHYHCLTACRQSAAVPIRRPLQELRLLHAPVPGHRGQEETRGLTDLSHPPVVLLRRPRPRPRENHVHSQAAKAEAGIVSRFLAFHCCLIHSSLEFRSDPSAFWIPVEQDLQFSDGLFFKDQVNCHVLIHICCYRSDQREERT